MKYYTEEELLKSVQWACKAQREDDALLVHDYFKNECSNQCSKEKIFTDLYVKLIVEPFAPDIDMADIERELKEEQPSWEDIK